MPGYGENRHLTHPVPRRAIAASLFLIAGAGCDRATAPPDALSVSLSAASLAIAPGDSQAVTVTVVRRSGSALLNVTGLPQGVSATLAPALLTDGETQSTLTLLAEPTAAPGAAIVAVNAVVAGVPSAMSRGATLSVTVDSCPGYAIPSSCPPFPTGGSRAISGVVRGRTAAGTQPLAGAFVWAWVQMASSGYSRGRVETDASGNYRISDLPPALILLQAWSAGYDQPCGSLVELTAPSATADIELVAETNPVVMPEPPAPALYGVVYEDAAGGRKPVSGARVFFETSMDLVAATTTTDEQGRYTLCRLPALSPFQAVTPVKAGYITQATTVSVSGVTQLDLEMERQ